jgi:Na+/H+-translocating membrane pyrophosphatase
MIGIAVCLFAIGTGSLVASYFDARYQSALTVKALLAYNASDLSKTFHINSFDRHDMLLLAGVIIGGSLLSAFGPLVSNLRRNPIKDMRDER